MKFTSQAASAVSVKLSRSKRETSNPWLMSLHPRQSTPFRSVQMSRLQKLPLLRCGWVHTCSPPDRFLPVNVPFWSIWGFWGSQSADRDGWCNDIYDMQTIPLQSGHVSNISPSLFTQGTIIRQNGPRYRSYLKSPIHPMFKTRVPPVRNSWCLIYLWCLVFSSWFPIPKDIWAN